MRFKEEILCFQLTWRKCSEDHDFLYVKTVIIEIDLINPKAGQQDFIKISVFILPHNWVLGMDSFEWIITFILLYKLHRFLVSHFHFFLNPSKISISLKFDCSSVLVHAYFPHRVHQKVSTVSASASQMKKADFDEGIWNYRPNAGFFHSLKIYHNSHIMCLDSPADYVVFEITLVWIELEVLVSGNIADDRKVIEYYFINISMGTLIFSMFIVLQNANNASRIACWISQT